MNPYAIKLLSSLKNISLKNQDQVKVRYSSNGLNIVNLLYNEGLIQSYKIVSMNEYLMIFIKIKIFDGSNVLKNIRIISNPSLKVYFKVKEIASIKTRHTIFVFSTVRGLMTHTQCKKYNLGGKLLFTC